MVAVGQILEYTLNVQCNTSLLLLPANLGVTGKNTIHSELDCAGLRMEASQQLLSLEWGAKALMGKSRISHGSAPVDRDDKAVACLERWTGSWCCCCLSNSPTGNTCATKCTLTHPRIYMLLQVSCGCSIPKLPGCTSLSIHWFASLALQLDRPAFSIVAALCIPLQAEEPYHLWRVMFILRDSGDKIMENKSSLYILHMFLLRVLEFCWKTFSRS